MTDTQETPKPTTITLAGALEMVEVTPSQAITILNSLAEGHTDVDPGLSQALNDAIMRLASGELPKDDAQPEESTSTY